MKRIIDVNGRQGYAQDINVFGQSRLLVCDGNCQKAWGGNARPRIEFNPLVPDDMAFLADEELGIAPERSGVWEGGQNKPPSPQQMNKWCYRECERSDTFVSGEPLVLPDFSQRLYNQPWLHPELDSQTAAV